MRLALLFFSILAFVSVQAQESPTPTPSPTPSPTPMASPSRSVALRFALPPLEGTISLGIYDQSGKLVRVLHREDAVSDFTAGHDALETSWDGTNDEGDALPNGKYSARGFVVGDLKVEGINYFFNDWVTDENSPHVLDPWQLWMDAGQLQINAHLAGGKRATFVCDQNTGAIHEIPARSGIHSDQFYASANLISPEDCAFGKGDTIWAIDALDGSGPREVKQFSKERELLRRLSYDAADPQPSAIEASTTEDKIFLIERNDRLQRLRALTLVRTTTENGDESVSDWKTLFEKKIVTHMNFSLENGQPVATSVAPQTGPEEIAQKLQADPLQHDRPGKVKLAVGTDEDGSFLKTADGLPLRTISDTPNLTRVLLARPNDNALDVFQDDGAVVEQFRVSKLAEMIAFGCGDFELK